MRDVVELRQYTLQPGRRDELIELFDRELVESQEAEGMAVLGQFRDLDRPDRFVWLRGFDDMPGRTEALTRFYTGPVWKANSARANATMIDVDDVLLLRPATGHERFPAGERPARGTTEAPPSLILATLYFRDHPFDRAFAEYFERAARPALADAGAVPFACLTTEYAENTFPALPVRRGVHAFIWFARFADVAALDEHLRRLEKEPVPNLPAPQHLRLSPTARSQLR
jgi:quinol monooxygenase YgiN